MILRRKADNFHVTTIGLYAVILKAWISDVIWNLKFVIKAYVWVHSQGILCGICVSRSDFGTLFFESPIRLCTVIIISPTIHTPISPFVWHRRCVILKFDSVIVWRARTLCHKYYGTNRV